MKPHSLVAATAIVAGTLLASHPVAAQGFDYTAAEQMFGEPVTNSVTGKPQRVSEAPANMTIVTSEEIRRTGADNLPDVLRFVPGLDVRRYGQQTASVGIRGYNTALNPRVLVLLDGRQVYQDDYGYVDWALIPVTMTEIKQIEIVKGPAAALYGFNAVSGVINIVTSDPLRDPVNGGRAEFGAQSTAYGEFVTTIRDADRAAVRLSAKGMKADEFSGSQANASREHPRNGAVSVDSRFRIDTGIELGISASASSAQSDLFADLGSYVPISSHANSLRSRLSADTGLGLLEFDIYRNEDRSAENNQISIVSWRQDVTVVRVSDLVKLGTDHVVRIGGEYRDNAISSLQSLHGRLGYTIAAGSAMWTWQVAPSLSLTNAVRVDHLSLSHQGAQIDTPANGPLYRNVSLTETSFNSGAVYQLTDQDTFRLSAARALQLPSLDDFGLAIDQAVIVTGSSGLRPSAVTNLELDYDRALPSLSTTIRFAVFGQRTDTTIGSPFGSGVDFSTGHPVLAARNFGSSREVGGEITLKGEYAGVHWNASYAIAAVQDATPQGVLAEAPSVSYQRQTPVHSVILGAGKVWGKFEVDAQARWQSHYQDFRLNPNLTAQPVTVPNYVTLDAHAAYRLTENVALTLTAQQLLQHRMMETGGLRTERRLLAGLRMSF